MQSASSSPRRSLPAGGCFYTQLLDKLPPQARGCPAAGGLTGAGVHRALRPWCTSGALPPPPPV